MEPSRFSLLFLSFLQPYTSFLHTLHPLSLHFTSSFLSIIYYLLFVIYILSSFFFLLSCYFFLNEFGDIHFIVIYHLLPIITQTVRSHLRFGGDTEFTTISIEVWAWAWVWVWAWGGRCVQ
jgi:hypothetical protein